MAFQADEMAARLRAEFPRALQDGQVVGYFQPEVELSTGRLAAAELLARWEHPELGTLPPALFIALAEELGLMREFSLRMLRQALAQHRAWAEAGWVVPVSVNIGPGCVADPGFPAAVAELLREEQVPGQMLALEVSEETGTAAASTRFFAQLAESGVQVSLDDFGTGFASLESLGGWPIDELKLDRSIVRPIITSASFRAIVPTTIDLAHQLGVKVVAEGVESAADQFRAPGPGVRHRPGILPRPADVRCRLHRVAARPGPARDRVSEASGYPQQARAAPGRLPRRAGQRRPPAARSATAAPRVQPVGGGTLAAAAVMLALYGLWQVFRWGGREHQALIGDLAFVPVNGAAAVLAWRVSRRADLGLNARRAWRLLSIALLLYMLGDLLQLCMRSCCTGGPTRPGPTRRTWASTWSPSAALSPSRPAAGRDPSGCGCCSTWGRCSPAGRCSSGTSRSARPSRPAGTSTCSTSSPTRTPSVTRCCCSGS